MVDLKREGRSLHVVLVDGNTAEPGPIVSKVKQALAEDEVAEVVIEIPGEEEAPPRPVVAEVIQELTSETLARGVPVRFKL